MDVAYPLGPKRTPRLEQVVYSIRTLWHHFPALGRVFVAGGKPREFNYHQVVHLDTDQTGDKWDNIGANLTAVLESDISEDFLWMNDDMFVTQNVTDIPLYSYRTIATRVNLEKDRGKPGNHFQSGMASQYRILKAWGYDDDTPGCDGHVPIVLNKTRLKDVLDRVKTEFPDHPLGHFRSLYGAGLETVPMEHDCKVGSPEDRPDPSAVFLSTTPASWRGYTGKLIRSRYWRVSPWEVAYEEAA